MIYFDYNATRPLRQKAKDALLQTFELCGNSSAIHKDGRATRKVIEIAREKIATALNLEERRIVFTSSATEADNTILKAFKGPVIISSIEHSAVHRVRDDAFICSTLKSGVIDLDHLEELLKAQSQKTLVSMIAAHNETGVIQPLAQIRKLTQKYNALIHTDAVQALGRANFDWNSFDFISFSGHKIGALMGVGIMVINPDIPLLPLICGGGQERSFRSGTENVTGIASFGAVIEEALSEDWSESQKLRDQLEERILEISPQSIIVGKESDRLPNTSQFTMPNVKSETQVIHFDLHNISVSAGSACSSGKVKLSRSLKAMGYTDDVSGTVLRVSLAPNPKQEDLDTFIKTWKALYNG